MELLLGIIIVGLLLYTVFKDILYSSHLDALEKKLMSKNLSDYISNVTPIDPDNRNNNMAEADPFSDLDEIPNPFSKGNSGLKTNVQGGISDLKVPTN